MNRFLVFLTATVAATTLLIAASDPLSQAPRPAHTERAMRDDEGRTPLFANFQRPHQLLVAHFQGNAQQPDATELIEKITVKIDMGNGANLAEPIALDLGLGYLFWLHPVGRQPGEPAPLGAIPQESTAKSRVAALESVTFTFRTTGDAGQDFFRTTQQLLANTRVGDIARVGFASKMTGKWLMVGYEIRINDRPFIAGKPALLGSPEFGFKRMAELMAEIAPLEKELNDLLQLLQANQLNEADVPQLADVRKKLRPLVRAMTWLQGQLEGKYEWFADNTFRASTVGRPIVHSAKVTIVTHTHTAADTENLIFVRIGGRKYFVSSPDQPLTGLAGPQTFDLDLLAGTLTDADLRDWGVGMVGNAKLFDVAPDRWHGERITFEIDGQVLFDSDTDPRDRLSLNSLRLVPPAHLDNQGQLQLNKEIDMDFYLWEASKGTGLNPVTGAPPVPPPPDGPQAALPEPGLFPVSNPLQGFAPPGLSPGTFPLLLLPGEKFQPVASTASVPVSQAGTPVNIFNITNNPPPLPSTPPPTPVPSGPLQVDNVRFASGFNVNRPFRVRWNAIGNESEVSHYLVEAMVVDPDNPAIFGTSFSMGTAPAGSRTFLGPVIGLATETPVPRFIVPTVTAVFKVGSTMTASMELGPARMVFPKTTNPSFRAQPQFGDDVANFPDAFPDPVLGNIFRFAVLAPPAPGSRLPIRLDASPPPPPIVWREDGFLMGDIGIRFEAPPFSRGLHIGAQPSTPNERLRVRLICRKPDPLVGIHLFVADLGFPGTGAVGDVTAKITRLEWFDASTATHTSTGKSVVAVPISQTASAGNTTAPPFSVEVDPNETNALSASYLVVTMEFTATDVNTRPEAPLLFGVRLIPKS